MAILPYNDKHWRNFFEIVGRPEVLKDPRYSTLNARSLHINDMYAMVEALAPSKTTAEWVKLLDKAQIPNAPVSRPADLFDDPHLVWRQLFKKYPHPSEGEIMMVEPPMRMSRTPPAIRTDGAADGRRFARRAGRGRRERGRDRGAEEGRRADRADVAAP